MVFVQVLRVALIGVPLTLPIADDPDPESDRMDFLSQKSNLHFGLLILDFGFDRPFGQSKIPNPQSKITTSLIHPRRRRLRPVLSLPVSRLRRYRQSIRRPVLRPPPAPAR